MRSFLDSFFNFNDDFFESFEKEFCNELRDYLEFKESKKVGKEVSPPCETVKTDGTIEYQPYFNDNSKYCDDDTLCCDNTCCSTPCCTDCTCAMEEPKCSSVVDGWELTKGDNGMPLWTRDVCVPVEKQYANVAVLNQDTVFVEYNKRVVSNEVGVDGYHSVGGSYSFPLPSFADVSTFKAKFIREGVLRLSVGESLCREGSYQTVNIEG